MPTDSLIHVDPDFSVYGLVKRVQNQSTMLQSRRAMTLISHEIENATLVDGAMTRIFSSFQRMSRFLPQVNRYRLLASRAEHIYVFGEMDVTPPNIANVTYVPLEPTHQLAKEWFIVSYGVDYFSALATEELTHIDDPDEHRQFKGLWTFDLAMVSTLHEWLAGVVGVSPNISQAMDDVHNLQRQIKLMSNSVERLMSRAKI